MKKSIGSFLTMTGLIVLLSINSSAFTNSHSSGLDYKGTSLLGAGFYLGYYGYGYLGSRSLSLPPINAYYELGVHEFITVGPFFGFARWSYKYNIFTTPYEYSWTFMHLGARGSFHLVSLFNEAFGDSFDEEKIDIYVTVMSGLEFRNYSSNFDNTNTNYDNSVRIFFGPVLGFRYYLGSNLALFVEGGRGALGVANFGLSARF
jgi:hypothetical protein